ncbi:hypothetical protein SK128_010638, partial [Halocaridina rubra]
MYDSVNYTSLSREAADGNQWFVSLTRTGGVGVARIGVITTASADPADSATFYEDLLVNTYGAASATWIPVTETSGDADTQV